MFQKDEIIKVLVPNVVNSGYDYRLDASADVGDLVSISVMNKVYVGLVIGAGDGNIPAEKIKSVLTIHGACLPKTTVQWIKKMSDWTMMSMGAVLKLIVGAADFGKINNSKFPIVDYFDTGKVRLNPEQKAAADSIDISGFNVHLLDGITGSGKTQVYFDAVRRAYGSGKSVLVMMPEIALTAQFIGRFAERFGAAPIVWHSGLTSARRRAIWRNVLDGKIKIVIGTRSALFLPWQDLGLIVVDEEHDSSYKQEEMGNYHARDMAILMAKIADIPIILASATPSFETIKNVRTGKYKISKLTSRFGGATLPSVEIVDMRKKELRVQIHNS
ncbi:MAG: primosomal protein N' [Rickettsiales bacterium]|jgi:primosomal protein N' (replication factor Y)|nr:primosomal protein N' [Rickettsiales bacterium]